MNIRINPYNQTFCAKFIENETLQAIRQYAQRLGKEHKVDEALDNIDLIRKETLLSIDVCYTGDNPTVIFSRFERSKNPETGLYTGDYYLRTQTEYENTAKKNINPIKFAYEKLIKLGNNAPNNNMYQQVVIDKSFNPRKERLF